MLSINDCCGCLGFMSIYYLEYTIVMSLCFFMVYDTGSAMFGYFCILSIMVHLLKCLFYYSRFLRDCILTHPELVSKGQNQHLAMVKILVAGWTSNSYNKIRHKLMTSLLQHLAFSILHLNASYWSLRRVFISSEASEKL